MAALQNSRTENLVPSRFRVSQNFPNPFRGRTSIKYCVAYKTRVRLTVYDTAGTIVEHLVDEEKQAGTYEVDFLSAAGGRKLRGGEYIYRFEAGEFSEEKRMDVLV